MVFHARTAPNRTQVYVAPFRSGGPPAEWIPAIDGQSEDDQPRFSPGGSLLYFTSERDGFRCLWAPAPGSGYPAFRRGGFRSPPPPQHPAIDHERGAGPLEISVGRDKIVFNQGELSGNIWMAQLGAP